MKNETEQNVINKELSKRKYLIPAVIILCILAGYIYKVVTWTPVDSESKKASEAIIRQAAAEQLTTDPNNPIDPNTLTDEDFAKINEFKISVRLGPSGKILYPELSDIKLLERFTNLQKLNLTSIKFPKKEMPSWMKILAKTGIFDLNERFTLDLGPLEKLTNLKTLNLTDSQVVDIEPLKSLENLQLLSLNAPLVSNLKPIKSLANLEQLALSEIQVVDIEHLKVLSNLKILYLYKTQISNLEALKKLSKLEWLCLYDIKVSDLEPLKELKNLKILYIKNCPNITDEQVEDLQKVLPDLDIVR